MAIKDQMSRSKHRLSTIATITAAGTTLGAIIDTATSDGGVGFVWGITGLAAATPGTISLVIEESDADDMTGAVTLTDKRLDLDGLTTAEAVSTAVAELEAGDFFKRTSVISNLRYVRANVVQTGTPGGAGNDVLVLAQLGSETQP